MPTFEVEQRFWNQYARLTLDERARFRAARRAFVQALRAWEARGCRGLPKFPRSLGVTPMVNRRNVLELAWAPGGRCPWEFGTPRRPGVCHVIWRRIGTHAIYEDP